MHGWLLGCRHKHVEQRPICLSGHRAELHVTQHTAVYGLLTWCSRLLSQALTLRYGEPKDLQLLKELAGAASGSALGPCWLGLIDINGQLGLDKLMKAANEAAAGSGRQKVELNLGQLGMLTQEQQ